MQGLSLVAASGGHSSSWSAGLSLSLPLLVRSTGSRRAGSVAVAHEPSCSVACGIFPDQGSNPCPLHWQADSQPLCHQGSPLISFLFLSLLDSSTLSPNHLPSWISAHPSSTLFPSLFIHLLFSKGFHCVDRGALHWGTYLHLMTFLYLLHAFPFHLFTP